jgi:crotonobetainyl-CoA:carnitine CoA-transferase CaiB-like acyl-CoA transferase
MLAYTDDQWQRFWSLAGRVELVTDPRFDSLSSRSNNIDALYSLAGEVLSTGSTKKWLDVLGHADIPAGPVNRLDDLRDDPHLKATGFFRSYEHPSEGRLEVLDTAFRLDRQALPVRQHNRDWVNIADKFWLRRVSLTQRWTRSSPPNLPL